jgi:hypothetical protein
MVLHGRGWGDNLAVRHGVTPPSLGDDLRSLRLPHNVVFSLAGRAGLLVTAAFLLVPLLTIVGQVRHPSDLVPSAVVLSARGGLAAAVATGMTDIYLESPQGGVVYWSLIGFLWWVAARPLDPAAVDGRPLARGGVARSNP